MNVTIEAEPTAIVFFGGGTGGHLYPGVAVAERARERFEGCRTVFFRTSRSVEDRVLAGRGLETRTITIIRGKGDLPEGTYGLVESFCPDPGCDCRRVMLNVVGKELPERGYLATISYGFDRDEEMAGPFLDPLNPQSE